LRLWTASCHRALKEKKIEKLTFEVVLSVFDLLRNYGIVLAFEWRGACEQNVKNYAHGPHVTFLIVPLSAQNLGSHVKGSSENLVHASLRIKFLCGSKINDFNFAVFLQYDVFRLQVSMHDVPLVAVSKREEDLPHNVGCVGFGKALTLDDLVEELAAFAQFSDEVELSIVLEDFLQLHNVRVVNLRQKLYLIHKHFELFLRLEPGFFNLLDRADGAILNVPCAVDYSEGTLTNSLNDLVVI